MKTNAMYLSLIILITLFTACEKENLKISPSNNVTSKEYTISSFEELNISDQFKVYITFSATEKDLRIRANDNLHGRILVEERNGELSIELENNTNIKQGNLVLEVFLTTDKIENITGQGLTQIHLQNKWEGDELEIELVGASALFGTLSANRLDSKLTGASNLVIEGDVDFFKIDAEGASNMLGYDFETNDLSVDLSGACNISLTVHNKLNVEATGASTVYFKGDGLIESQDLSGGSKIIKMN